MLGCCICSGQKHSVRPQMIACTMPGHDHTEQDLSSFAAQAAGLMDPSLMQDAWQVRWFCLVLEPSFALQAA